MSHRSLASARVLIPVIAVMSLAPELASSQGQASSAKAPSAAKKPYQVPRTPWGHPDLEGVWNSGTVTPLERPKELAGKEFLTQEEAAAQEQRAANPRDRPPNPGDPGTYNQFWFDRGTRVVPTRRTSLIVDPPDGRIPPYTPEAQKRGAANRARLNGPAASWLDRDAGERCLTDGMPITPLQTYNLNTQIFQTPEYVAILAEMYRDLRIVPLDGRPHGKVPQYLGDPRGHWEGDTLVVDSTTFADTRTTYIWNRLWQTPSPTFHLVERFTRIDADTIDYQFTITDPSLLTRPLTVAIPLAKIQGVVYEYACHEGNYGLRNILAGARAQEKAAGEAAKK